VLHTISSNKLLCIEHGHREVVLWKSVHLKDFGDDAEQLFYCGLYLSSWMLLEEAYVKILYPPHSHMYENLFGDGLGKYRLYPLHGIGFAER
jgi:hypothetical protein